MALLGYARVSTDGQSLTAQVAELKAAGCTEIFQEKVSGAKSDRKQLARLIRRLEKDDALVVTRLDRLARSTKDLLNLLGAVADKGAGFKSLRDTWADTTTPHGRLILTVLGGLAEFERELIRSRTGEGLNDADALKLVRMLAADSDNIVVIKHAKKRRMQRMITRPQIERCVQKGTITEGPFINGFGNWQMNLTRNTAGEQITCVVAIDWATRILVITTF